MDIHVSIFLFSSPEAITILLNDLIPLFLMKTSKQNCSVFSSTSINIDENLSELIFSLWINKDQFSFINFD